MTPTRRYAPRLSPPDRREQLLDAARELVVEAGYGECSINAVARRAGVTRPVVYEHFADRDDLLAALVQREQQRMLRTLTEVVGTAPPADAADASAMAGAVLRTLLESVQREPATWRLVYVPAEGSPPGVRRQLDEFRHQGRRPLEQLIAWAVADDDRPIEIDIELLAEVTQAFAERAAMLTVTEPEEFPPARIVDFITQLVGAVRA